MTRSVAGLKIIARKIEALDSEDFGNKFNEKLIIAKILGCLPKDFDNFVTSWSILSGEMSLELFLKKEGSFLVNAEKNIEGRSNDVSDEVFKSQSKSISDQVMKTTEKKFKGKCHKCGKIGYRKQDCRSKLDKSDKKKQEASKVQRETKESKDKLRKNRLLTA